MFTVKLISRNAQQRLLVLIDRYYKLIIFVPTTGFLFFYFNPFPVFQASYATNVAAGFALPLPVNYSSANLLPAITNRLFSVSIGEPNPIYLDIWLSILIASIFAIFISIFRSLKIRIFKILSIFVFIFLPMHSLLLNSFDLYNIYIYLGIALCCKAFFSSIRYFYVGAAIFIFAHPEQALAAFTCLFILTLTVRFQSLRKPALVTFILSVIAYLSIYFWFYTNGFRGSRTIEILFSLPNSIREHLMDLYASVEVIVLMYGVFWPMVIFYLTKVALNKREKVIYTFSLLGLPILFWFITSDGLRCVVPVTTLLTLTISSHFLKPAKI